jgi:hypothetical protein
VKVKICNISAKPITLKPKSVLCSIQESKLLDDMPLTKENYDIINLM